MTANGTNAIDILLSESFKEIASTRPIEKITIKEITDKAGVIRPTFYNHFQDKYELLEWIVKKELIEPMLDKFNDGLSREGVLLAFNQIEKDRAFYRNAAKLTGQNSFRDIITEDIKELLIPFINPSKLKGASIQVDYSESHCIIFCRIYCGVHYFLDPERHED